MKIILLDTLIFLCNTIETKSRRRDRVCNKKKLFFIFFNIAIIGLSDKGGNQWDKTVTTHMHIFLNTLLYIGTKKCLIFYPLCVFCISFCWQHRDLHGCRYNGWAVDGGGGGGEGGYLTKKNRPPAYALFHKNTTVTLIVESFTFLRPI